MGLRDAEVAALPYPLKLHCYMASYLGIPHSPQRQVAFTRLVEDSSHLLVSSGGKTYLVAIGTGSRSASAEMQTMGSIFVLQGSMETLGWYWEIGPVHRGWGGLFRGGLKASAVVLYEGKIEYAGLW